VFTELITILTGYFTEKGIHIFFAIEVFCLPALPANDQMLVAIRMGQISVASIRLVHALNEI
jgi:hypothetical protein